MKNKKIVAGLALVAGLSLPALALASTDAEEPMQPPGGWPQDGIIGAHFDRQAAQRGFQVYKEVCHNCHSLKYVAFRNLEDLGFNEAEVKAIAAGFMVQGEPDSDTGEVKDRPGKPFDHIPSPFPNPEAAAASNNGAVPPDLSLMAKAREGGPSHIYSVLQGYKTPTAEELKELPGGKVPEGSYYNPYKAGHVIAMPPPLSDGLVQYGDGQPQPTVQQMAYDVSTFLAWAAEPKLEQRKRMGFFYEILLLIVCGLLFASYKRISKRVLGH
ncbi:MAG: cytochrome c1 [Alphaproteobacteria bacterium]|nr:cytochrome c1 [Alphaproteobacteria bacterium]